MKKIFFTTLAMLILSLSASSLSAQDLRRCIGCGDGKGMPMGMMMHKPFHHLEMMQYMLDLTNTQVDKAYKIEKEYMDKFYQNRNNPDKIKELREKQRGDFENILTPDQKTKWNEFIENHPMKRAGRHAKGMCGSDREGFGPMGMMPVFHLFMAQKDLGLTDEQLDKIYKIHKDGMDSIYQNRNDGDRVRDLRKKQEADVNSVLTADQKKKLDEMGTQYPCMDKRSGKGNYHHMHNMKGGE